MPMIERGKRKNLAGETTARLFRRLVVGQLFVIFFSVVAGVLLECTLSANPKQAETVCLVTTRLNAWQYGLVLAVVVSVLALMLVGYFRIVREINV